MAIRELRLFFTVPGWWCFDNNSGVSFNIRLKAAAVGATRSHVRGRDEAPSQPVKNLLFERSEGTENRATSDLRGCVYVSRRQLFS